MSRLNQSWTLQVRDSMLYYHLQGLSNIVGTTDQCDKVWRLLTVIRGSCMSAALLLLPLGGFIRSKTGLTAEPRASRMLSGDSKATAKIPPSP